MHSARVLSLHAHIDIARGVHLYFAVPVPDGFAAFWGLDEIRGEFEGRRGCNERAFAHQGDGEGGSDE